MSLPVPAEQTHLTHPKYRADIDGLRAIAVLSVVGFHAFPFWVQGGFIGVDIFFVISGFLISAIIFENLQRDTFSFVEFYSRRIKRIFPALLVVLTASFAFGWFVLFPDEYKQLGKHIVGGAGFISNFLLWRESGYFDNAAKTKPLLHLWSLGVEEQFYIIWPTLLWFAWKQRLNLLIIAIAVGVISFALNVGKVRSDTVAAFYSPQTRFWELMAGSVLAYIRLYKQNIIDVWLSKVVYEKASEVNPTTINNTQSLLGAVLIGAGILIIKKEFSFPGWWAVLPTFGAVLIISAGPHAWLNRAILSRRILVWFGLISYPLYLWHWPLLSFARFIEGEIPSSEVRIAAVLISIALAWMTYRLIETPIRFGKHSIVKTVVLVLIMAIVGYVGYNVFKREGLAFRQIAKNKLAITTELKWDGLWEDASCVARYGMSPCKVSGETPDVIILGDSHGNHLYPGLADFKEHTFLSAGTCAPLEGIAGHVERNEASYPCTKTDFLEKNFLIVSSNSGIKTAILSTYFRGVLGDIENDREREVWGEIKLVSKYPDEQNLSTPQLVLNGLKRTIKRLTKARLKVIFVRDTLDIPQDLSPELSKYCGFNKSFMAKNCTIPRSDFVQRRILEDKLVDELKAFEPNLTVIDPMDTFCDLENCFLMRDGVLYYRDIHHLSVSGSKLMAEAIRKYL